MRGAPVLVYRAAERRRHLSHRHPASSGRRSTAPTLSRTCTVSLRRRGRPDGSPAKRDRSQTGGVGRPRRDDVQANTLLQKLLDERDRDDPTGYVGEWHSHPIPYVGVIAVRRRLRRMATDEATVNIPDQNRVDLTPLPEGAVRADGPVFISYRQSDGTPLAEILVGLLRAAGLVVWHDRSDLRAGTTTNRLERALTGGLSAAVLIVTPDIAHSEIVKNFELPRLLQLDEDPRFSLSIANQIPGPDNSSEPDYGAPDRLLGVTTARTLRDKKQSDSRTCDGRLEIVRDLLMHRVELLKRDVAAARGTFTITTQTRTEPSALDAGQSDLSIRIKPAKVGKLPSRTGLTYLQVTLPLTSDAVRAYGASTIQIAGGMHLSVALALGAALPETKIGHVEVTDLRDAVWTSKTTDDPNLHQTTTEWIDGDFATKPHGTAKIAVFVKLRENADDSAFRRLIRERPGVFSSATVISLAPMNTIDAREAARLSVAVANEIKRISASLGRAEIHLAYYGPYTMAVLVGRYLNTLRTVVYEWDNPEGKGSAYTEVFTLEPGVAHGPITHVHVERLPGDRT